MNKKAKPEFIVINMKHLESMPEHERHQLQIYVSEASSYLPEHHYIVCNTDEPYASDVMNLILQGEEAKVDNSGHEDFLKTHPKYEKELGVNPTHCIVNRRERDIIVDKFPMDRAASLLKKRMEREVANED